MSDSKTALVISAHSADFVWRAGGAIALHAAKGYDVTVVCLSYGERGESAKLWKQEGMTLDKVKAARREEAENAASALGVRGGVWPRSPDTSDRGGHGGGNTRVRVIQ